MISETIEPKGTADMKVSVRQVFGIDSDLEVPAYTESDEHVPDIDPDYLFDRETTLAILAGFARNRRVMIQGYHGTGKSTHIEQVASRLNWPCVRVNLDSHISRIDLVGKDAIVIKDGMQVTEFQDGILPWALQTNTALVFDEYDAGRPDVMFVIQRVLEVSGKLTLLDQRKVIKPHPAFRLFSTTNTIGLGDTSGLYHGTQQINQGQMDRWSIVTTLNYLPHNEEVNIVLAKAQHYRTDEGRDIVSRMVRVADLTRNAFMNGDLSTVMSPRTVITWAEKRGHLRRCGAGLPHDLRQQVRRGGAQPGGRVLPALLRRGTAGVGAQHRGALKPQAEPRMQPKPKGRNAPTEPFKQAVSATTRAIAGPGEAEVTFASDRPGIAGDRIRIPEPPRKLTAEEAAVTRGHADSLALRVACHDNKVHRRLMPEGRNASALFEAVEQARVEAIGAQRMSGVASNLAAMLEDKCERLKLNAAENRGDAPLEEAIALMARERMTGQAPPEAGAKAVDLWRTWIEEKAGDDLGRLCDLVDDQHAFGQAIRDMIVSLNMADELGSENEDGESDSEEEDNAESQAEASEDGEQQASETATMEEAAEAGEEDDGDMEAVESFSDEMLDDAELGDEADNAEQPHPNTPFVNDPSLAPYKVFTGRHDEFIAADELCEPEELERLRGFLDKQLQHLQGVVTKLANRLQRRLMAQQNRDWDFDLEEGMLDPARLPRIIIDPFSPLSFRQERDTDFRDTVVTLLLDNSGSMRGRPITVPRPAPTSWRGRWNDAGSRSRSSASLRGPGRAGRAASNGLRPTSRPIPAASTTCATSSTRPPIRRGGGRGAISG